jgi:hypothetical protein
LVSREQIACEAEAAARAWRSAPPVDVPNPYPPGTDAFAAWEASFERYLHALQAPEGEGTA